MKITISKKKKMFLIADLVAIVVLVFIDQLTKFLAVKYLQDKPPIKLIDGVLELFEKQRCGFWAFAEPEGLFYTCCSPYHADNRIRSFQNAG